MQNPPYVYYEQNLLTAFSCASGMEVFVTIFLGEDTILKREEKKSPAVKLQNRLPRRTMKTFLWISQQEAN